MKNPPHSSYIILLIFLTILDLLLWGYILFYPGNSSVMSFVRIFDIGVCILLWIEFIYSYLHSNDKKQFMKENAISILGMLPADFIFLRALRLIRLVHLIKQFIVERNGEKTISNFLKQTYLESVMNQLKLDMTIF
jgi:voltage-gated potassium channel